MAKSSLSIAITSVCHPGNQPANWSNASSGRALNRNISDTRTRYRREYWTEIDRALERKAERRSHRQLPTFSTLYGRRAIRARQEMERLAYLQKLGLAREIDDRTWWLAPEHESELRKRQRDRDIIKTRARERMQQQSKEREIER